MGACSARRDGAANAGAVASLLGAVAVHRQDDGVTVSIPPLRRHAILLCDGRLLAWMFIRGVEWAHVVTEHGLPEDAEIVGAEDYSVDGRVRLIVKSQSFKELAWGEQAPELEPPKMQRLQLVR